jgi:hypothetical protein
LLLLLLLLLSRRGHGLCLHLVLVLHHDLQVHLLDEGGLGGCGRGRARTRAASSTWRQH